MTRSQLDLFADYAPTQAQLAAAEDALPKTLERVPVARAATILGCTTQHIYNLIFDGTLLATNIARSTDTRPEYRVFVKSIAQFIHDRMEGKV